MECIFDGCRVKPRSGQLCHKHKKIQLDPGVEDFIKQINTNIIQPDTKIKYSKFYIVINTNRTDRESAERLVDMCQFLYDEKNILEFIVDRNGLEIEYIRPPIIVRGEIEVGKKFHKIHSNDVLDVAHRNNIRIDLDRLREFARKVFGYMPKINIRVMDSEPAKVNKYIKKEYKDD